MNFSQKANMLFFLKSKGRPKINKRAVKTNWMWVPKREIKTPAERGPIILPKDSKEKANPIVVPCPSRVLSDKMALAVGRKRLPPKLEIATKPVKSRIVGEKGIKNWPAAIIKTPKAKEEKPYQSRQWSQRQPNIKKEDLIGQFLGSCLNFIVFFPKALSIIDEFFSIHNSKYKRGFW